jgi:predicted DsbA family dithiol-disulfide isomerase
MGGLLPSWENFNRGGITKPSDVASHWNEVASESGMPIHSDIWINDPLHSSYPPSIAFKAAQLQHEEKSILFLRRLNEFVFLEGKNIANLEMIIIAAKQTGINIPKLLFDMKHKATKLFNEDLEYTKTAGVNMLPTFIIKVNNIEKETLEGIQTFESFESSILKYAPYIPKSPPMQTAMDVFKKYPSITITEFSYLTNSNYEQSKKVLHDLLKFGIIVKQETKAGSVFLSKSKVRTFVVY